MTEPSAATPNAGPTTPVDSSHAPSSIKGRGENADSITDRLAEEQTRDLIVRRRIEIVKVTIATIGAIAVFWLLKQPDSVVTRTASEEAVARERSRLLLDVLHESDPIVRHLSFEIIRSAYPSKTNTDWLDSTQRVLKDRDRYTLLEQRAAELTQLLRTIDDTRVNAAADARTYKALLSEAYAISRELQQIHDEFTRRGIPLPKPPRVPIGCVTLEADSITATSARLVATPFGAPDGEWFDFGTSYGMGFSVDAKDGYGTARNLAPNTTYYYRYVTYDPAGSCLGDIKHFKTPAAAHLPCATVGAADVTSATANLIGRGPEAPDQEWFDFGTDPAVAFSVDAKNGRGSVDKLRPKSTYYFRYRARANGSSCSGDILSFTTPPS